MPIFRWIDRGRSLFSRRQSCADSLADSIARAESYLAARICQGELVSRAPPESPVKRFDGEGEAFMALEAVAALGARISDEDKRLVMARLLSVERNGAWAYAPWGGIDSDTTASAIRALDRLGHEIPLDGLVVFFNAKTGLYHTFHDAAFVDAELGLQLPPQTAQKHKGSHPCVLANIYLLLHERGKLTALSHELLQCMQKPDGAWSSYFYPSPFYATRLFTELLTSLGAEYDRYMRMTLDSLLASDLPESPTQAAEMLLSLHCLRQRFDADGAAISVRADALARQIVATQLSDGSWPGDLIWEFVSEYDNAVVGGTDCFRVRSTALCMRALESVGGTPSSGPLP
jgi:hypothetical protein